METNLLFDEIEFALVRAGERVLLLKLQRWRQGLRACDGNLARAEKWFCSWLGA